MKLIEILLEKKSSDQGYVRALKRVDGRYKLQYRCTKGPKKGKVVAEPATCFKKKNMNRMLAGRAIEKATRAERRQQNVQTKKTAQSKRSKLWNRVMDPEKTTLSVKAKQSRSRKNKRRA